MVRDVQPQHVALMVELHLLVPLGDIGHDDVDACAEIDVGPSKKVELPGRFVLLQRDDGVDRLFDLRQKSLPRIPHGIERPRLDEALDGALVAHLEGNLVEEILERREGPLLAPSAEDALDDVRAHVAHRGQAEANLLADRGKV